MSRNISNDSNKGNTENETKQLETSANTSKNQNDNNNKRNYRLSVFRLRRNNSLFISNKKNEDYDNHHNSALVLFKTFLSLSLLPKRHNKVQETKVGSSSSRQSNNLAVSDKADKDYDNHRNSSLVLFKTFLSLSKSKNKVQESKIVVPSSSSTIYQVGSMQHHVPSSDTSSNESSSAAPSQLAVLRDLNNNNYCYHHQPSVDLKASLELVMCFKSRTIKENYVSVPKSEKKKLSRSIKKAIKNNQEQKQKKYHQGHDVFSVAEGSKKKAKKTKIKAQRRQCKEQVACLYAQSEGINHVIEGLDSDVPLQLLD